jgi:hypothetical membrane protein
LYVVLDAVAQALPPHYSPIRQAESDLAVGPYGYVMAINFVNRGVLSLLFVVGFYKVVTISVRGKFRTGLVLLTIWGVGAFVLSIFPTDLPGSPATVHGEIHLITAAIAFICGAFGILFLSLQFVHGGRLGPLRKYTLPIAIASPILCFATFFGLASRFGGLLERLFLGSVLLWMFVVSIYLINPEQIPRGAKDATLAKND